MSSLYFFFFFLIGNSILADSTGDKTLSGPLINVTKHISFPDFSLDNPRIFYDVILLGSAKFSKENGAVQIPDESESDDLRHLAGRALYSYPVRLLDPVTGTPASFESTFSFQFKNDSHPVAEGDGSLNSGNENGGSGLTFIIVPDEFTVGRSGPWLGMLNDACDDDYKAVAIEFDSRQNPEFGDPNDNHIGINLGSIVSTKTVNASDVGVSLKDGKIHQAWIKYDGTRRWMDVYLGSEGQAVPSNPAFSGLLDLFPFLKEYMFVGFSASTGNLTQIHNVFSWNFTSISQASLRLPSEETCESRVLDLNQSSKGAKSKPVGTYLIFAAVLILAVAILVSLYYNRKRKDKKSDSMMLPEKIERPRPPNKPRRFSVSEISYATRGFGEVDVLGSDSRGIFYRGKLLNGCQIAVKRFSPQFLSSVGLQRKRILKEICAMSQIRHPNLVPIRGWCYDKHDLMVVYDFFPNGGLDKWLFGVGVLPWTRRFKVIKHVAEALSFLHSKKLAHKNMRTTSVLLDVSFRAVLGDFGFTLSGSESKRFEAAVSQSADVFEFGIFVLEVVAGRGRLDPEVGEERKDLLDFAWRMHEMKEKNKVVDSRMGSLINLEQAIRVLEIGLLSTVNESRGRPTMEEVVEFLGTDAPIPRLPPSRPVVLFPYSSATGLCTGYSCAPFK